MIIAIKKTPDTFWEDHLFRVDFTYEGVSGGQTLTQMEKEIPFEPEYGELYLDGEENRLEYYKLSEVDVRMLRMLSHDNQPILVPTIEERDRCAEEFLKPFGLLDEENKLNEKGWVWAEAVKMEEENEEKR